MINYMNSYLYLTIFLTVFCSSEFVGIDTLEYIVKQQKEKLGKFWFENIKHSVSSMCSNTLEDNWFEWVRPTIYKHHFPYPNISDNTEGIAGFHDLPILNGNFILLDIGGGNSDSAKNWLKFKYPLLNVFVVDPFARGDEHNHAVQKVIEEAGGADISTSISVLNAIQEVDFRIEHILTLHRSLKKDGIAYFKVWSGFWPVRGTGKGEFDVTRNVFQANAWASKFNDEVSAVFGHNNVFSDNNLNMLVARK